MRYALRWFAGACLLAGAGGVTLHAQEEPPPSKTLAPGKALS